MKKVVLLGSTGSIGSQTVEIIGKYPSEFEVIALSTYKNIELLAKQIKKLNPKFVGVADKEAAEKFKLLGLFDERLVSDGKEGLVKLAHYSFSASSVLFH